VAKVKRFRTMKNEFSDPERSKFIFRSISSLDEKESALGAGGLSKLMLSANFDTGDK